MRLKIITIILITLSCKAVLTAQLFNFPETIDTRGYGKYIGRTMQLLSKSDVKCKKNVKILVYGQSISVQDWWHEVRRDLGARFPNANIIMENRAIGGFSSQYLYKTVETDVVSFYPDLVLLYDYGSNIYYDSILSAIRSRTTAEIAMNTDHFIGENHWSDTMAYHILPRLASKYHCELWPLRNLWKQYIEKNDIPPAGLTTDGQHLNEQGNFLMAELIKPFLKYDSAINPDADNLLTIYRLGRDIDFTGDTLTLSFRGNKADIVTQGGYGTDGSYSIWLDGHKPSEFQGCYFASRPYNSRGESWPWELPGMIRIQHLVPWTNEEWTCIFKEAAEPFSDFSFAISGSVTGDEGMGKASRDFISPSKKVIIRAGDAEDGGDWHLHRSFNVLRTIVHPGDTIKWKTYSICTDLFLPGTSSDPFTENTTTLFQGIANTMHTLQIIKSGKNNTPIKEIRIYRPFWNRQDSMYLAADRDEMSFAAGSDTSYIKIRSNAFWEIKSECDWIKANPAKTSDNSWVRIAVTENSGQKPRFGKLKIKGTNQELLTITITQEGIRRK